jgi:hypothetical protein
LLVVVGVVGGVVVAVVAVVVGSDGSSRAVDAADSRHKHRTPLVEEGMWSWIGMDRGMVSK